MLNARAVSVAFKTVSGTVPALDTVDCALAPGDRLGVVGESGSGKSTLALALAGFAKGSGRVTGSVTLDGRELVGLDEPTLRRLRRENFGFVFQNPITTLDPTMAVRRQFFDPDTGLVPVAAIRELLTRVGLTDPDRVLAAFPHELSGGMAQRVAIAMMLARRPSIIIADEPTSALDAQIRLQIMALLVAEARQTGAALVVVSHDLKGVRADCDRVAVMYAGRIVEEGPVAQVLDHPRHPYTAALLAASPGNEAPGQDLTPIPGTFAHLASGATGCAFAPRCARALPACRTTLPEALALGDIRVACLRATVPAHG
jgi:oligopeptide/dipeptide ABC transporter ATP-binding protein